MDRFCSGPSDVKTSSKKLVFCQSHWRIDLKNITQSQRQNLELNLLLCFIGALQILYVFFVVIQLSHYKQGYLPSPFFINKSDTLMDLFNPMSWVDDDDRYTLWRSVYPPLNFLILGIFKTVGGSSIFENNPYELRAQNIISQIVFLLIYITVPIVILSMRYYSFFKKQTKILIYIIFITGIPALYALERGNLIVIALPFIALSLSGSVVGRISGLATLINLKPYFLILGFLIFFRKYWAESLFSIIIATILFFASGLLLGDENYLLIFENLSNFDNKTQTGFLDLHDLRFNLLGFSNENIQALLTLTQEQNLNSEYIYNLTKISYLLIGIILILIALKRNVISIQQIYTILYIVLLNITGKIGGYSLIIYFCLLPIIASFRFATIYLVLITLINAPIEIFFNIAESVIDYTYQPKFSVVYLGGEMVTQITAKLSLGTLLRPLLNAAVMGLLIIELIKSRAPAPKIIS